MSTCTWSTCTGLRVVDVSNFRAEDMSTTKVEMDALVAMREQIEARLKVSQRKGSTRESEAGAQKVTEATLDIILRVIKPPRAVVVAMVG